MERKLTLLEVLLSNKRGQLGLVDPCGDCPKESTPDKCKFDGESALGFSPEVRAAQCLITRRIITLSPGGIAETGVDQAAGA